MKRGPHPRRPRPGPHVLRTLRVERCESWIDDATGDLCSIVELEDGTGYTERLTPAEMRSQSRAAERTH